MFKRKRSPVRASNRFLTRRQANRTFKHAVREKVININVKCQTICTLPGDTCPNGGKHILVASQEVFNNAGTPASHGFDDALRITKLEGVLWMRPDYRNVGVLGSNCQDIQTFLRNPTIFRMGLLKSRVQQTLGGIAVAVNPLSDGIDPFHLADAVDSQFLKTWDHLFQVQDEMACGFTTSTVFKSCMPTYNVPASVDGTQPGYTVPAEICCTPCEGNTSGTIGTTGLRMPGWHPFRISYRRPIVVKENEDLNLWFGWEQVKACEDELRNPTQPPMMSVGHVFMTVEH